MAEIHSTAIVAPDCQIGDDVQIGPFCIIEDGVTIGDGCRLCSHVVVKRGTQLGNDNFIAEHATLGGRAQHLKAPSVPGSLVIGSRNEIREYATIHLGLATDSATTIGNDNLLMVSTHVAHDCRIGDRVVLVNNVMLGGHVQVDDQAFLGADSGVHQFCRVGRFAMLAGKARVVKDVPPYVMVDAISQRVVGLNRVGLRRNGFRDEDMQQLKAAYRLIYRSGLPWHDVLAQLERDFREGPAAAFYPFLKQSQRGWVPERQTSRPATISYEAAAAELRRAG